MVPMALYRYASLLLPSLLLASSAPDLAREPGQSDERLALSRCLGADEAASGGASPAASLLQLTLKAVDAGDNGTEASSASSALPAAPPVRRLPPGRSTENTSWILEPGVSEVVPPPGGIFRGFRDVVEGNASGVPVTVKQKHLEQATASLEVHNLAKDGMLPATGIMMAAFLLGSIMSSFRYTKFIPETLCTVAVAVVLGGILRHLISCGWITLDAFTVVDASILNLFLLPIIIFEGGWSVNLPHFMAQFPYILIFAILGTLLSTVIIGSASLWLATMGIHGMTSVRANFAFASLISATDPVATLTTFSQLNIADRQPLLNTLVFGESMINDAVAIVFFNAFNHEQGESWQGLFVRMVVLMFGSMCLGTLVAGLLILPLRAARLPGFTMPEVLYVFLTPYFVFSLAETVDFSGIIATLFAGIVFRLYGAQHLTEDGELSADHLLEALARFADGGVFIICGTSTALMTSLEGIRYGLIALVLCLLARAIVVLICSALSNRLKRSIDKTTESMITWKHEFMIWLSGLRGGIGLVLALEIDEKWCGAQNKNMILNTTFFLICALLLICGGTTEPCLKMLGLVGSQSEEPVPLAPGTGRISRPRRRMSDFEDEMEEDGPEGFLGGWLHGALETVLVGQGRQSSASRQQKRGASDSASAEALLKGDLQSR